ncbi:MAG: hypothetical protein OES38_02870 [Gammaproteobacteria bacterium]|nr:hypothetical protein [Gammaproteobacteria bacterium]
MKAVFQLFWQICRLKQSPEFVPTASWFVAVVIIANLICSLLVSITADAELTPLTAATSIVVGQTTTAALTWIALNLRELGNRFLATITALFGCDLIITASFALVLPLTSVLPGMAALVFLLFLVWSISVAGFILHRALKAHLAVGIMVALGMSVMSVALSQLAIGA